MSLSTAYFTDLEKQYINWSEFERSIRSDAPPDEDDEHEPLPHEEDEEIGIDAAGPCGREGQGDRCFHDFIVSRAACDRPPSPHQPSFRPIRRAPWHRWNSRCRR